MTGFKRLVAVLLLAICVSCCAFAVDGTFSNKSFRLYHVVSGFQECGFEFWDPSNGSSKVIQSRALEGVDTQAVAVLMFLFSSNDTDATYQIQELTIKVSDMYLVNGNGEAIDLEGNSVGPNAYECYPFDFKVTDPESGIAMGTIKNKANSNGALSSITIVSQNQPLNYKWDSSSVVNRDEIAKLWVTPHDSDVAPGNYMATVTIEFATGKVDN